MRKLFLIIAVLLASLLLTNKTCAQLPVLSTDSLIWLQQEFGWIENWVPTNMVNLPSCCPDGVPDSLCKCYLDSVYVLSRVDSVAIPEELFEWFEMAHVLSGVWVGMFMYYDTGFTVQPWTHVCSTAIYGDTVFVDTFYSTRQHIGIMVYVRTNIGEVNPIWKEDN